jgi:hypothetical protein
MWHVLVCLSITLATWLDPAAFGNVGCTAARKIETMWVSAGSPNRAEGSVDTQPSSPETPDPKKPALSGIAPAADSAPAPTTPEPWPGRTLNPNPFVNSGAVSLEGADVSSPSNPTGLWGQPPQNPPRVGNRVVWGPPGGGERQGLKHSGVALGGDPGIYPDVAGPGVGRPSGDWARGRFVWPTRSQAPQPARG